MVTLVIPLIIAIIAVGILIACVIRYERLSKYRKLPQPTSRQQKALKWVLINKINIWLYVALLVSGIAFPIISNYTANNEYRAYLVATGNTCGDESFTAPSYTLIMVLIVFQLILIPVMLLLLGAMIWLLIYSRKLRLNYRAEIEGLA